LKKLFKYFELTVWITALLLLAVMKPGTEHFSLCIFKFLGITFCPGCGLGHSISYLFHSDIAASLNSHPLGIFAVIIIIFRILKLFKLHFLTQSNNYAIRN